MIHSFSHLFFYVALASQCRRCHARLEKPYCTRCKAFALICVVCNIAVKGMIDNYYNHNYVTMFAKKGPNDSFDHQNTFCSQKH